MLVLQFYSFGIVFCQVLSIRPELALTSTINRSMSNSGAHLPFKMVYYNQPDISLNSEFICNDLRSKFGIGIGTFSSGFHIASLGSKNGQLGFLFPNGTRRRGNNGALQTTISGYKNVLAKKAKSAFWIGGGVTLYLVKDNLDTLTNTVAFGNGFSINKLYGVRQNAFQIGLHASGYYQINNRRGREVLQLFARYTLGLKKVVHFNTFIYDHYDPSFPGGVLRNQQTSFRQNGTNIQIGISKTLKYFPAQRKWGQHGAVDK